MNRLHFVPANAAEGHAAQLYSAIKSSVGMVPNAYVGIGSNSPAALEAALQLDGMLKKGSLSGKEIEAVKLVVSQAADCDYCLAAHTAISKLHGLSAETIVALRHGAPCGDARLDALAAFTVSMVSGRGELPAQALADVRAAGYTDTQLVEAMLAVASITFTNVFNRVNATALDFPPAA